MTAWLQSSAFLLVVAWSAMDHGDDGVDIPRRWLADKQVWMYRSDPGLELSRREMTT